MSVVLCVCPAGMPWRPKRKADTESEWEVLQAGCLSISVCDPDGIHGAERALLRQ